jgi:hypothetical protein
MPELPEVEVTRMSFANEIAGATVLEVRLGKPLRWPLGCDTKSVRGPADWVGQGIFAGAFGHVGQFAV